MQTKIFHELMVFGLVLVSTGSLAGCAEIQQAAENAARGSGNQRLAKTIHEIGHVTQKHILDVIQRSKQIAGVAEAGLAYANKNPEAFKNVIDGAVKKLLDEGLDQSKELESDRLAVVFGSRVGYDPTAYVTFLDRLRTIKGDDQAFFKTHPKFSDRLTVVQSTIRDQGLKATGVLLADRFSKTSNGIL